MTLPAWANPPDPEGWTPRSWSDLEIIWEKIDDPSQVVPQWNTEHPFYPGPKAPATADAQELGHLQAIVLGAAGGTILTLGVAFALHLFR